MINAGGIFGRGPERRRTLAGDRSTRAERLVHAFWASLFALAMAAAMLLEPVDWMIWASQSRFGDEAPSGRIVYVEADSTLADPDAAGSRAELAEALDGLRDAGVERVYVNVIFPALDEPSAADAKLDAALDQWGESVAFVDRIDTTVGSRGETQRSEAAFTQGRSRVWNGYWTGWPAFSWRQPFGFRIDGQDFPSLAAALAGKAGRTTGEFEVEYAIRSRSITSIPLAQLSERSGAGALPDLTGKVVVIGTPADPARDELRVPGQMSLPPSFVAIHAAETLLRGPPGFVPGFAVVGVMALLLCAAALAGKPLHRNVAYAVAAVLPFYSILVTSGLNLRVELAYAMPLLVVFALLRWRANWKRRVAQIDLHTGLPSFRALMQTLGQPGDGQGYVVVAKVHGYETILKSLEAAHRASYMKKLVERIRIGDARMTVYVDGHHLGWRVALPSDERLRSHLEGLRALFAAPVVVNGRGIDVGITFGAAHIRPGEADRSIAAALAAVEETTEALEPIKVADDAGDEDTLWDLSLRARIDAAMEAGEVFCVYQPKFDIVNDKILGVEALVRWEDPERGFIPPMHFVMQCEKAGRMEYLTRYVLQSSCSAAKLIHFRGNRITMSVNISATLLTDMRIVGIVRNVLQATGFDPAYLVLEITETARIRDLVQARTVLKALKALGAHLSMDDFGVGAANFEALQALPFDELKIDRQFVSRAATSAKARAITASIVGLGTAARIAVVAEGAETEADLQMLREIGCWQVQGYALARPMPLTKLLTFMESDSGLPQAAMV